MPNGNKLEPVYKQIGRSIKFHRLLHGMTQIELGKKLGHSRMSIAQMECGTQRIQVHTLLHMQEIIGVSLDTLVGCGFDGESYSNIGKRMRPHLGGVTPAAPQADGPAIKECACESYGWSSGKDIRDVYACPACAKKYHWFSGTTFTSSDYGWRLVPSPSPTQNGNP